MLDDDIMLMMMYAARVRDIQQYQFTNNPTIWGFIIDTKYPTSVYINYNY